MFGIGPSEFVVIMIVAILVLGPEHLPKAVRTFNKVMSEFRKVSTDFQRTMNLEAHQEEAKSKAKTVAKKTAPAPAKDASKTQASQKPSSDENLASAKSSDSVEDNTSPEGLTQTTAQVAPETPEPTKNQDFQAEVGNSALLEANIETELNQAEQGKLA